MHMFLSFVGLTYLFVWPTNLKHDSSQDMPALQPRVRLRRLRQRKDSGNWHAKPDFGRGAFQMFKLAWPSHGIVCRHADTAPAFWFRLDAVRESNAAAFSYQSQAFSERLTGSEHERRIDALRR